MGDCPLPGTSQAWSRSVLGPHKGWDESLKAHAVTLSSFAYPSAVFWGSDLVLLHNQAWIDAGGIDHQQGCPQRDALPPDIWDALRTVLNEGKPKQITAKDLLRSDDSIAEPTYLVLLSPLFLRDAGPTGIMAQLIPQPDISHPDDTREPRHLQARKRTRSIGGSAIDENHALDEHPFFERFAEMLPSGLAILDHEARAVFVNQHFYDLTTRKGANQSYTSWPDSIHPDDKQRVLDAYQEAFKHQRQLRTEFRALISESSHPWRLLLLTPLGDENLRHVSLRENGGFICSIVDISSEKSAELAERKAAREAEERKIVLTNFIDMVSHEIRNPLSAVLHCSEDISEAITSHTPDVEAIREAIDTINICILHQKSIVDDVLSFSKLDASMLALVPSPCEPYRDLTDSLKMFQPEFRKQGLGFSFQADESYAKLGITWVMADMARICQVLVNLVTNAIKFTINSEGEKHVHITIGASKDRPTSFPRDKVHFPNEDDSYRMDATNMRDWGHGEVSFISVAVEDSGIGISEEGQKQLFGRFKQATAKTASQYGGSGLGLNISKKLCQLHGGEIAVSSQEGSGSTFSFFFKAFRADPPDNVDRKTNSMTTDLDYVNAQIRGAGDRRPESRDDEVLPDLMRRENGSDKTAALDRTQPESEPTSAAHDRDAGGRASVKPRVLLVEDNVINQRLVSRKLVQRGFEVTTANNGREAVAKMHTALGQETAAYDIILMDSEMPVLDGNAATREIRDMEARTHKARVPILGVTANARPEQREEMLSSGMMDVISKPYKIGEMIEKMNRITETRFVQDDESMSNTSEVPKN